MKAIILAAGYATRLYPLTKTRPKPLLDIGGKSILEYLLDDFVAITELDQVYVVTNQKFAHTFWEWARAINNSSTYPFNIEIVNDGTTSNETRLGAIADIQFVIEQKNINDDLLIAAGDNIFQFDFGEFYKFYQNHNSHAIVAQKMDDPVRLRQRGVVKFNQVYQIVAFQEKPQNPPSNFVCPVLYLHPAGDISLYQDYLSTGNNPDAPGHFIKWLYQQVAVYAYVMKNPAIDIGTLEVYERFRQGFKSKMR